MNFKYTSLSRRPENNIIFRGRNFYLFFLINRYVRLLAATEIRSRPKEPLSTHVLHLLEYEISFEKERLVRILQYLNKLGVNLNLDDDRSYTQYSLMD